MSLAGCVRFREATILRTHARRRLDGLHTESGGRNGIAGCAAFIQSMRRC